MKYDFWVRHNGIDYAPNTEVPDGTEDNNNESVDTENKETQEAEEVEETEEAEKAETQSYSKTDINRMSTENLKMLAKEQGLDDSKSGAELKKELIEKFGL